ncbi:12570_t:CDS:2, partial [Racocetra persica]
YGLTQHIAMLTFATYQPPSLEGILLLTDGKSYLEPAVPLTGQLVHQWSVHSGPCVLRADLRKFPTPTTDRDQTVSRM